MVTWNVAGVSEKDLAPFFDHVSMAHPWDVICLQEAFRRTEGLAMGKLGHTIYTPASLHGDYDTQPSL